MQTRRYEHISTLVFRVIWHKAEAVQNIGERIHALLSGSVE